MTPLIRTPDPKNARQGFVEPKQFAAVLDKLPAWAKPVAEFCYLTGWRNRAEVLGERTHWDAAARREVTTFSPLTWRGNVEWKGEDSVIRLEPGTTKNGEGREFPFGALPALKALLAKQLREGERFSSPYVFFIPTTVGEGKDQRIEARPVHYKPMRKAWRAACRAAKVKAVNGDPLIMHDHRRTTIRRYEQAGVSRSVAMSLTGHETESTYTRYAIADAVSQREGVAKVARLAPVTA